MTYITIIFSPSRTTMHRNAYKEKEKYHSLIS